MIEPGQKVTYVPEHGTPERGVVKTIPEDDDEHVFVVYHCNHDWDNYENFTAARTPIKSLLNGWPADKNKYFKYYLHSDKGGNKEFFRDEVGIDEEAIEQHDLAYTAYEVEFDCKYTEDGQILATHVGGVKLEKPLKLN